MPPLVVSLELFQTIGDQSLETNTANEYNRRVESRPGQIRTIQCPHSLTSLGGISVESVSKVKVRKLEWTHDRKVYQRSTLRNIL